MGFFGGYLLVQGFFGVLLEALGIFLGLDFWLHSITPVTWNPEYPPWGTKKLCIFILTESWAPDTDKIIVQFFKCKIPERVFLNGAISICRRFSKVSHRFEATMCGLSLLALFLFEYIHLRHATLICQGEYSKRKSSITAPGPLTTKLIWSHLQASETQRY